MERKDPVGEKYYKPLGVAEKISGWLFWVSATLSILTILVDAKPWGEILTVTFVVMVIANFVAGFLIRLWLAPRAEEQRRLDLLSNSYAVNLTHENAIGYFNNSEKNPIRRLALSVMESSFFTSKILGEMLRLERAKIALYFVFWISCISIRTADLSWVVVATQALFSEEIIAKYLRMEWYARRCEAVYTKLHRLITTTRVLNNSRCHAQVLENFSEYEATKARASIGLSERIFNNRNSSLSDEWNVIRRSLGLE
ncbi:hypothetical protein CN934_03305 [Ensifer sp. MMN_5]|nr:hypothetical protein CN934_03305 [Ensifer sp. MMN_5]